MRQIRLQLRKLPGRLTHSAIAAGTAANPDNPPFYLDMPFEIVDGEAQIVQEVAERINAADAVHDLVDYLGQPERLNAVMLYHGRTDHIVYPELVQSFAELLTDSGVEHEYLEVPGGHCNLDWDPVVEFMAEHLAFEMPEE